MDFLSALNLMSFLIYFLQNSGKLFYPHLTSFDLLLLLYLYYFCFYVSSFLYPVIFN